MRTENCPVTAYLSSRTSATAKPFSTARICALHHQPGLSIPPPGRESSQVPQVDNHSPSWRAFLAVALVNRAPRRWSPDCPLVAFAASGRAAKTEWAHPPKDDGQPAARPISEASCGPGWGDLFRPCQSHASAREVRDHPLSEVDCSSFGWNGVASPGRDGPLEVAR